jgi:hypothetical protein
VCQLGVPYGTSATLVPVLLRLHTYRSFIFFCALCRGPGDRCCAGCTPPTPPAARQPLPSSTLCAAPFDPQKSLSRSRMAEVASFSSSSSIILSFPDHITGRRVSLSLRADETCYTLSPLQLRAQIKCPLELVKAAAWFLEQQSPLDRKRSWIALPPPFGHMLAEFSPHVPVRCMFGCIASACQ